MTPGSADFRRANRNPGYQCLPRAEYVQRALEMVPRGSQLAEKLTVDDVRAMRSYVQAPFEDISKSDFDHLSKRLHEIDLTNVYEEHNNTDLAGEVACGSGG